jgi:collagenase-like PrtC family protease
MELVVASNFDAELPKATRELPIASFFGNFPTTLVGGGRPPHILPKVSGSQFREHLSAIHAQGREFYATMNTSDLGLREYSPGFYEALHAEIARLVEFGVDGFVVAIPALVEWIHREYPYTRISVSTFARIRTVSQGEYYLRRGADTLVIEEANRDVRLLRGLVEAGARVEVLVNQTCIHDCPFRFHHLNTSSLASQTGTSHPPRFEYPLLQCGLEVARDPAQMIAGIFVRPEDLAVYEEQGIHRFKISGRNQTTEWIYRAAKAYSERQYRGNLLDILSFVQNRGPRAALQKLSHEGVHPEIVAPLLAALDPVADLVIDNQSFPPGFLRRIAATDCGKISCSDCGYCASVARRVVRVQGRPLSEYVPPHQVADAHDLLPAFGGPSDPGAHESPGEEPAPPIP